MRPPNFITLARRSRGIGRGGEVRGDNTPMLVVPDLEVGNMLAKNLTCSRDTERYPVPPHACISSRPAEALLELSGDCLSASIS